VEQLDADLTAFDKEGQEEIKDFGGIRFAF
jgi:hypothetical protein